MLDHASIHLVTHSAGQVKATRHNPPQGDVIVIPAGTAHCYEVLGDEQARVVGIDSPPTAKPDG